ncbi:putative glutamine-tRNA ligase [Daldinia childiae]|uniref:putative glutamine-tRNA ligase n=1 Tax=Daldinia childiae TaxID=326645 RepID=UPI001445B7B1|nr:putative glutamine-tRNA ligase [Daldinia childiae]KAF3066524.1 putative glutamine-tRNA ligase [Daldinia childiae]
MAGIIAESTAKLQLDEETGEMVSKNELKKRMQKRAKKAAAVASSHNSINSILASEGQGPTNAPSSKPAKAEGFSIDPDAMSNQGFLAEVYRLHLSKDVESAHEYLRFDDTNPDAEKEEYCITINDMTQWLGFTPAEITYSSDNFQRMYDLAEELIKQEKAYVCHCNEAETRMQRGGEDGSKPRYRCEHSKQDVETNLQKFRDMRNGEYAPQAAWLRMKQDMENPNPSMWDIAAYRIPNL